MHLHKIDIGSKDNPYLFPKQTRIFVETNRF